MTAKTVRQACRDREPLDGADAQCLEHALTQAESQLAAERERREAAESDAVEDAANAELQLQAALAAQKQAEERAAGLEKAMRKMRSGGLVPTFWVQFADDAIAAYETALADSRPPAGERGREVVSWPSYDQQEPLEHDCPDCPAKARERCRFDDLKVPATMVHIRRIFTPQSNAEIEAFYTAENEGRDGHAAVDALRAGRGAK